MNYLPLKRTRGFTLIELLIVVTIIAILASLSFAVYGKVTQTARSAKSVANLKQLGSTWTMAAGEGAADLNKCPKNYFQPYAGHTNRPNGYKYTWMDIVGEYMGYCAPDDRWSPYVWNVDIADTILRNPVATTISLLMTDTTVMTMS